MKFYCIQEKKAVNIADSKVKYRTTVNGRRQAVADYKGVKLYKFVKSN
jgi:hypothetical protein